MTEKKINLDMIEKKINLESLCQEIEIFVKEKGYEIEEIKVIPLRHSQTESNGHYGEYAEAKIELKVSKKYGSMAQR